MSMVRNVALALLVTGTLPAAGHALAQTGSGAFPLIVSCSDAGTDRFFYLSTLRPDGTAVYLSPDNIAATITSSGAASRIQTEGNGTCTDKTVDQLRADGQTYDAVQGGRR